MTVIESRKFIFEDKEYEIRVVSADEVIKVMVFTGEDRANGYTYSVDHITNYAFSQSQGLHGYEHLLEVAESDVRAKYWENYLKSLEQDI